MGIPIGGIWGSYPKPFFEAYISGSVQNLTSGVELGKFSTILVDSLGYYIGASSWRYTPLVAGYYKLYVRMRIDGGGTIDNWGIYKNAGIITDTLSVVASGYHIVLHKMVHADGVTDFFDTRIELTAGACNIAINSVFGGYYLGNP